MSIDEKVKEAWLRVEQAMEHESFGFALRLFTEAQDITIRVGHGPYHEIARKAHQLTIQRGLTYIEESLDCEIYDTCEVILGLIETISEYIEEPPPAKLPSLYKRTHLLGMCKEGEKIGILAVDDFDSAIAAFVAAKAYAQKAEPLCPSMSLVKDTVSRGIDKLMYAAEKAYNEGKHARAQEIFDRASIYAQQEDVPLPPWSITLQKKLETEIKKENFPPRIH